MNFDYQLANWEEKWERDMRWDEEKVERNQVLVIITPFCVCVCVDCIHKLINTHFNRINTKRRVHLDKTKEEISYASRPRQSKSLALWMNWSRRIVNDDVKKGSWCFIFRGENSLMSGPEARWLIARGDKYFE